MKHYVTVPFSQSFSLPGPSFVYTLLEPSLSEIASYTCSTIYASRINELKPGLQLYCLHCVVLMKRFNTHVCIEQRIYIHTKRMSSTAVWTIQKKVDKLCFQQVTHWHYYIQQYVQCVVYCDRQERQGERGCYISTRVLVCTDLLSPSIPFIYHIMCALLCLPPPLSLSLGLVFLSCLLQSASSAKMRESQIPN